MELTALPRGLLELIWTLPDHYNPDGAPRSYARKMRCSTDGTESAGSAGRSTRTSPMVSLGGVIGRVTIVLAWAPGYRTRPIPTSRVSLRQSGGSGALLDGCPPGRSMPRGILGLQVAAQRQGTHSPSAPNRLPRAQGAGSSILVGFPAS